LSATTEKLRSITIFEELGKLERRNRALGRLAIAPEQRLLNNDALADVFLVIENNQHFDDDVEAQIEKNYLSDMSERSGTETKEKHFYLTIDYSVEGDDLVADNVKSYKDMMLAGLEAATADAEQDPRLEYAKKRAEIQTWHLPMLLDWYHSNDPNCVRISSLCPTDSEIPERVAKAANFKPDRLMASEWIFERTADGMRMHAFSQDNLTLKALEEINKQIGIIDAVSSSTMDEMSKLVATPFRSAEELVNAQQASHDNYLNQKNGGQHHYGIKVTDLDKRSSNQMAEAKPEAKELWKDSVKFVAQSLASGRVNKQLADILKDLKEGFGSSFIPCELQLEQNSPIGISQAREFMDYLRKRAIPQYIFGDPNLVTNNTESPSGISGIASAGSYAFANGISHEGDCPTSGGGMGAAQQEGSQAQIEAAMHVYGKKEFKSKWCPNCLPVPKAGKEVSAWREGDSIGCYDCGHEVSICTQRVVRRGKKNTERIAQPISTLDLAFESISKNWIRIKQSLKLKYQRQQEEKDFKESLAKKEQAQSEALKYGYVNLYF
jgi:hypothetical protein